MNIFILGNGAGSMRLDGQAELECNWMSECEGDCVCTEVKDRSNYPGRYLQYT